MCVADKLPNWSQAYGNVDVPRRARVTELRGFGASVVSWKRLDTSTGSGIIVDHETLWGVDTLSAEGNIATPRSSVPKTISAALPRREQKV